MPTHQSASAKEFIDMMSRNHGRRHCDRIVIPITQRELARRYGLSPGTINWYLNHLGDQILERRPFITIPAPTSDDVSPAAEPAAGERTTADAIATEPHDDTPGVVAAIGELTDA